MKKKSKAEVFIVATMLTVHFNGVYGHTNIIQQSQFLVKFPFLSLFNLFWLFVIRNYRAGGR